MRAVKSQEKRDAGARKTGIARLLEITATKKTLVILSAVFSASSAVVSFLPYIAIYWAIREILAVWPDVGMLDASKIAGYGWLACAGVIGNILLYFGALIFSHLAAFGTLYRLKVDFASHLARVPLGFHVMIGSGKLRKVMDQNIEKIEGFIAHQFPDMIAAMAAPVVMVVILLRVNWKMGLACIVGILLVFGVQASLYGREGARAMMDRYQKSLEEMNNASVEYIRGIAVVKAFRQTVYSFRRLHDTIKAYTSMVISYTLSWENGFSFILTLLHNIYLFVIPTGILIGMGAEDYRAFASTFIFYLLFVPAVASVMIKVVFVNNYSMQIMSGVEAMDAVLDEPELPEPAHPKIADGFDIAFEDVRFSYDRSKETEALKGVSFQAKQGEVTAIVGPSGGGKSTIAHLIPRFFDVTEGRITLGGCDVREMRSSYLMQQVSFVFQDVFLFKQSIRENIRMGNPEATDRQIEEAARAAQCHDFIEKLPGGYDTIIGTRGFHLSGGERQRIAIARAIVKDAPVVVLDEATAFADPENEHLIQKAFETLMKSKTVIIIAHRLSTVRSADKIVVVEDGRVIQEGTHASLLSAGGRYEEMWRVYNEAAAWTMKKNREVIQHA